MGEVDSGKAQTASVKIIVGLRSGDINECAFEWNTKFTSAEEILRNKDLTNEE